MRPAQIIDILFKHGKLEPRRYGKDYAYFFFGYSYGIEESSKDYREVLEKILMTVKNDLWSACRTVEDESK